MTDKHVRPSFPLRAEEILMEKVVAGGKRVASKVSPSSASAACLEVSEATTMSEVADEQAALPDASTPGPSCSSPSGQALFLQKVRQASEAVNNGDFRRAVQAYTEAITLDPSNHILYTNRAAAYFKLHHYRESQQDALASRQLNPKWTKAYLREGVALQHLGQHGDALAAFAAGLVQEPANAHLLAGLRDTALKSPLKDKFQATFQQLEKLRLVRSPFVLMAVVGQELLAACNYSAAVSVLEAALQVGTCSLKLRGSVFSALASAHWGLGALDKALYYMQQDLAVTKSLGDQDGECRAYGNLGSAFFTKGQYKESLTHHRFQLVLAMRLRQRQTAGSALSSLGHVYTAIGDYPNALASHKQCVLLLKQGGDKISEAREIGNVGAVYLAMGNFNSAVECHQEHLKIARALKSPVEEARAHSNLGSAYHYKRDYMKAMAYHKEVLKIAEQRHDRMLEARAYAGLGHAARCASLLHQAQFYHEKQLDNALQTKDRVAEGRACANLGIIYHQLGEYDAALKLHKKNLEIARSLADKASQGRAYGNMGNAYSALGKHEQAVRWHKQALTVSTEVGDFQSQGSTHGNLAVAYQSLGMYESALQHYISHLNVARELKDLPSEARALCNLGNFHCARGDFPNAVSLYEQFLVLSRELRDAESESKACFNLGYVHFNMGNFTESERYYEQDLAMARKRRDRLALARAYCNLGLAQKSLGKLEESLECQKKCLRLMETLKLTAGKFRALGNIGDLMLKMGDMAGAVRVYNQQHILAQQAEDQDLMASSLGALGNAHRLLGQHDKALSCHTQELTLRQEKADLQGECRAHGHLGNVYTSMGNYHSALKYYQEMLDRSRDIGSHKLEGQACGNLGITRMNMGQLEEAIGFFEQQLAMLEQQTGPATLQDKVRAFSNLGDCYEALGDFEEAVKWHEQCLILAQQLGSLADQDKAYRGLGNAHKAVGNLQQALVCFEKRLYVAHQLSSCAAKASAYGELGCLHSLLGNFEQAISCLEQQLGIAREMGDKECEGDAACGLGGVYQQMCEYETALKYHGMDLHIAEVITSKVRQCRAYGNLGLSHESLGNYKEAVKHQEQHLSIAAEMNDRVAKTLAYSSLGRVHQALGHHTQAVQYLQQGLAIAEQLRRREDEAKIRHRLGLALWGSGNLEECQKQMNTAADLFETIRRESQCSSEYKLSLFDLQTACYQALQRVLVSLGRPDEALVVAERACTRAFIDLLLERQAGSAGLFNGTTMDLSPITIDQMTATVAKQKALVLCFSVAAGSLYTWLLSPKKGLVKFHELSLWELENDTDGVDTQSLLSVSSTSLLDHCVGQVRESMGIETHIATTSSGHRSGRIQNLQDVSDAESDANSEVFQQQLEELGGRLNAESDRTGFLAMINRAHTFNSSAVSLGSVLSLPSSSLGLSVTPQRQASFKKCGGRSPLSTLYQCLMAPMEEAIAQQAESQEESQDLVLVLQGDLYLIPFLMLRAEQAQRYLFERFNLIIVPSISALNNTEKLDSHGRPLIASSGALVVGNPQLTPSICQHWHLKEIPGAEYEARILGELLSCRPLIGSEATKGAVLHQVEQVEVIHFATHISWKLSSIVLSPGEFAASTSAQHFPVIDSDDSASDVSPLGGPSLSEYLLTAADILNLRLHAKLVVLNSGYTDDRAGRVNTDGVVGLTRALLSAGAQCVLFSLWPVPDAASKLLMRTLYSALQEGQCITQALSKAVKTVQSTKQFSHPANWGGWVVVGQDVRLASKVALMSHSLGLILQTAGMCREILRVLLHLMEKSLQRIQQGARNPMYTTVQSVENKVGAVPGWKELLQAVGFRFEPATAGLPPAVFFPQSDPGDRLAQASGSLQALLGLPPSSLTALSKFVTSCDVGEALIQGIREILSKLSAKEAGIDMVFSVQLWHVSGCHEFLASLGLDLVAVGSDNVTLRLSKQAVRRHLQFALQALVSVFNTHDAPHLLSLDNSSSMESLSSCHSASSPSTPSLSSPTPASLSHYARGKRSIFNPAEMERMRNFHRQDSLKQGGSWDGQESSSPTSLTRSPVQMDPAMCLSHQNRIRSLYGSSSTCDSPSSDTRPSSLPSPFQDSTGDADSIQSCDGPELQPVARCSVHESGVTKSVKFAEQLVREQVFDPASPKSNSGSDSEGVCEAGRKASQFHHHFEQHAQHRHATASCSSKVPNELLLGSRSVNKGSVSASTHVTLSERKGETEQKAGKKTAESPGLWPDGKIDPEDVVQKVLADVASQQAEVERLQQQSAALSFERSFKMRAESNKSSQPFFNTLSGSSHCVTAASPRTVPACEDQNSSNTMADKSLRKTADRESQLPPPYPSPPSYNKQCVSSSLPPQAVMPTETRSQVGGGAHPRVIAVHPGCQTGENSISSDNSEGADSNVQSSVSSGYHSESSHNARQVTSDMVTHPHTDRGLFTKDFVNQSSAGAFPQSLSTSTSSFESLSSFRPYHPSTPLVYTNALHNRPESSNSLSSQYSTSSSNRSVIYRPLGDGRICSVIRQKQELNPFLQPKHKSPTAISGLFDGSFLPKNSDLEVSKSLSESFEDGSSKSDELSELGTNTSYSEQIRQSWHRHANLSSRMKSRSVAANDNPISKTSVYAASPGDGFTMTLQNTSASCPKVQGVSDTHHTTHETDVQKSIVNVTSYEDFESDSGCGFKDGIGKKTTLTGYPHLMSADSNNHSVKTNKSGVLFLDSEHRIIAKSNVLQSSKC